jgi:hypothetical protein
MRVEDLSVELRPRRPWEAVDLGCVLVRRDYSRVLTLWLATVVPVWAVLAALLWRHPFWFSIVVWWLKPLYDRVPLFFLGRAAFGNRPGFRETWKEWPQLWGRFLFSALLWRRLSPIRSFALPVWILEDQRGAASHKRIQGLSMQGGSVAFKATVSFLHLEIVAVLGLWALTSGLAPESGIPTVEDLFIGGFDESMNLSNAFYWYANVLYMTAITMIEPFYVGAGFGLYLNCRSKLEGWDIEVAFRKLATRVLEAGKKVALVAVALVTLTVGLGLAPGWTSDVNAQDSEVHPNEQEAQQSVGGTEEADEVTDALATVYEREEFKIHRKQGREWMPQASSSSGSGALEILLRLLSWGIFIAFVCFVAVMLMRYLARWQPGVKSLRKNEPELVRTVMGMELTPESLPDDLRGEARRQWQAGNHREAMSLLYRGALSKLTRVRQLPIQDSDTEDDCLLRVAGHEEPDVVSYFTELTRVWVTAAYADRHASSTQFDALCERWPFEGLTPRSAAMPAAAKTVVASITVLAFTSLLCGCEGEWYEYDREIGYKGKARVDPFLAAQQLLIELGHDAERSPEISDLPYAEDGVIFASAENGMPVATGRLLLNWVRDGGSLVYVMAGGAPYSDWSPFAQFRSNAYLGNDDRPDPVLDELGVTTNAKAMKEKLADLQEEMQRELAEELELELDFEDNNEELNGGEEDQQEGKQAEENISGVDQEVSAKKDDEEEDLEIEIGRSQSISKQLKWRKKKLEIKFLPSMEFYLDRDLGRGEFSVTARDEADSEELDERGYYMLSLKHGTGRITLLNHAQPFRNRFLGDADHAQWLNLLVGKSWKDVRFVLGFDGSFWALLWEKAWAPLLGVALLTLLWLWKNLPRFGPIRQVRLHETQRFADHLSALGPFYLRIKRPDVLLTAAREAVHSRLQSTLPQLLTVDDEALFKVLAQRSELSLDRVRAAMHSPELIADQRRNLTLYLQDLQSLRNCL